ncbi:unnamed protein product [Owenia fusiformis]|uniref:Uncharacterized protein n=1 Tax=Owenia fusiformis TaxID=6347 RepID=A0A8J1TKY6_OWEFU|nr:unnamed protein product [Owenia fusiformis]
MATMMDLAHELEDTILYEISELLGDDVNKVFIHLGFEMPFIQTRRMSSPHNAAEWIFQLFVTWKQKQHVDTNKKEELVKALKHVERHDLVKRVNAKKSESQALTAERSRSLTFSCLLLDVILNLLKTHIETRMNEVFGHFIETGDVSTLQEILADAKYDCERYPPEKMSSLEELANSFLEPHNRFAGKIQSITNLHVFLHLILHVPKVNASLHKPDLLIVLTKYIKQIATSWGHSSGMTVKDFQQNITKLKMIIRIIAWDNDALRARTLKMLDMWQQKGEIFTNINEITDRRMIELAVESWDTYTKVVGSKVEEFKEETQDMKNLIDTFENKNRIKEQVDRLSSKVEEHDEQIRENKDNISLLSTQIEGIKTCLPTDERSVGRKQIMPPTASDKEQPTIDSTRQIHMQPTNDDPQPTSPTRQLTTLPRNDKQQSLISKHKNQTQEGIKCGKDISGISCEDVVKMADRQIRQNSIDLRQNSEDLENSNQLLKLLKDVIEQHEKTIKKQQDEIDSDKETISNNVKEIKRRGQHIQQLMNDSSKSKEAHEQELKLEREKIEKLKKQNEELENKYKSECERNEQLIKEVERFKQELKDKNN